MRHILFLMLFGIGLAACAPQYHSTYQFVMPKNRAAQDCALRCGGMGAARAACHERCGGQVIEQRTCVAGCKDTHVAPVATPMVLVEE